MRRGEVLAVPDVPVDVFFGVSEASKENLYCAVLYSTILLLSWLLMPATTFAAGIPLLAIAAITSLAEYNTRVGSVSMCSLKDTETVTILFSVSTDVSTSQ